MLATELLDQSEAPTSFTRWSRSIARKPVRVPDTPSEGALPNSLRETREYSDHRISKKIVSPQQSEAPSGNSEAFRQVRLSRRARRITGAPKIATQERFWLLQKLHGQVLQIHAKDFDVALSDPSDPSITEYATFQKSELSQENVKMLRAGATFYWFIGLRDLADGQRKRESVIWMRRAGHLDKEKYDQELQEIKNVWGAIDWEQSEEPSKAGRD